MTTQSPPSRCLRASRRPRALHLLVALAGAWAAAPAFGADVKPMLLLDERLELSPIELTGVSQATLQHIDSRGQARARPIGRTLGLLPRWFDRSDSLDSTEEPAAPPGPAAAGPGAAQTSRPWITLVDGQRIVGEPDGDAAQEDAIAWRHMELGTLVFRLDRIRRIVFAPDPDAAQAALEPAAADDVIVLRNGDRLAGFVLSVQPDVQIESGDQTLTVPIDRVARVELVNPAERARGTHLWLTDGTRIGVHSMTDPDEETADGALTLYVEPPSESPLSEARVIRLAEISAVAFEAGRLVALTDLSIEQYEPEELRRTSRPPVVRRQGAEPLGAGDVLLPGPMTIDWVLPEGGVRRLAGWAALPPESFIWGDCDLIIETIDGDGQATEASRARLRGMTPVVRINEELPEGAARLRIRLESGQYGAVQDRVVLERFLLLTSPE